jgi:dethiobiotin synthetase
MNIFVTGTDTSIGKTIVSAWLCIHLNANYWKPVQSGSAAEATDSQIVKNLLSKNNKGVIPEKYIFKVPLSPHTAAIIEGKRICMNELHLPNTNNSRMIVEGAGGILTPLNDEATICDLMKQLNLPVILVARSSLGTINHTCLTLEALRNKNIPVLGVIMNGPKNESNKLAIEKYGRTCVLDELEMFDQLDHSSLKKRLPSQNLIGACNELSTIR